MRMASKALLCAGVAGIALLGCAGPPLTPPPGSGNPVFNCTSAVCEIPVAHNAIWPFANLSFPDEIVVNSARPVTLKWTLSSKYWTRFDSVNGIMFAADGFKCAPEGDFVFTCVNSAGPGRYKYSITTRGFGSPPVNDPSLRNG